MKQTLLTIVLCCFCAVTTQAQNQEWTNRLSSPGARLDEAADMIVQSGQLVVAGSMVSAAGDWDIGLSLVNADGSTAWTRTYGAVGDQKAVALISGPTGFHVIGYEWGTDNRWHAVALQYDMTGTRIQTLDLSASSSSYDKPVAAARMPNGNIAVVLTSTGSDGTLGTTVLALNPVSGIVWTRSYAGTDGATPAAIASRGNHVAVVGTESNGANNNAFMLLYQQDGTTVGTAKLDDPSLGENFVAVQIDASGNVYAAGWEQNTASSSSVIVARFKSDASRDWLYRHPAGSTGLHRALTLQLDSSGKPVVAARFDVNGTDMNFNTFKMKLDGTGVDWSQSRSGPGTQADRNAPLFLGGTAGVGTSPTEAMLFWPAALDDVSMRDELRYHVYLATSRSGQDFNNPTISVQGRTEALLTGLQAGMTYYAVVRVEDAAGNKDTNTREVEITLSRPPLVITTTDLSDGQIGVAYSQTLGATGGMPPYTWQVTVGQPPAGLQLSTAGALSGTPTAAGNFTLTIRVTDSQGDSASKAFTLRIHAAALAITTTDLPEGMEATAYSATLTASGGTQPYSWSLAIGTLPPGLALAGTGMITGTPTQNGTFNFTVRVRDAASDSATKALSILVKRQGLRIVTATLPNATPGQTYSTTLSASGGTPPYQWKLASGELPPGLRFTAGGVIRDTARDDGTYQFTVRVMDSSSDSVDKALTLQVDTPPALRISKDTILAGGKYWFSTVTVDSGYTVTLAGNVVICATDSVTINGTITGDCMGLEIRNTENLTVGGAINNKCTVLPDSLPGVKLVSEGFILLGKTISSVPVIQTDGGITITDPESEFADLTPVFLEEFTGGGTQKNSHELQSIPPGPGGGAANRPMNAGGPGIGGSFQGGSWAQNNNMTAGNGNDGGGNADLGGSGGSIHLGSRNGTLTIGAGVTITAGDGGKGKSVVATGCPAVADASANKGGRGGTILLGGQSITFGAGVTLNRGNGGQGGDATATGDPAAGACANGCDATATGGPGGPAGGIGYMLVNPGSINGPAPTEGGGNGGKGGKGTATASHGNPCPTCPGGKGGNGGMATATGGPGGDGASGKIWPVAPGSHKSGDGGDADATGGNGGAGASCCVPPPRLPGGNGGSGGSATATGGPFGAKGMNKGIAGTYKATGGNGANGGDGKGPGSKGTGGGANGAGTPGSATNGKDGNDGTPCFIFGFWWIYFSSIPDGGIIPGNVLTLGVYSQQNTGTKEAQVNIHFLTQVEFGGHPVQYEKQLDDVVIYSGGIKMDMMTLQDVTPPIDQWHNDGIEFEFRSMSPQNGIVILAGLNAQQQVIAQKTIDVFPNPTGTFKDNMRAPTGQTFATVVITSTVPIRFNHWWIGGWFFDP